MRGKWSRFWSSVPWTMSAGPAMSRPIALASSGYSVYAFHSFFQASGAAGVYVGTQPATAQQAADAIREEFAKLARHSLTTAELESAKQQVKGQLVLALEGPVSRMYRIAGSALYAEPYKTIDTLLAEIDAVQPDQVAAVASEFYEPERQVVVWLGPS